MKIRFSVPVERVETTIFNPRVESRCFNPLHSYRQSDSQKSCYEKWYTLLETKQSESISCDCSPRFTRAANFTLMQSLCFAPCNVIYYCLNEVYKFSLRHFSPRCIFYVVILNIEKIPFFSPNYVRYEVSVVLQNRFLK